MVSNTLLISAVLAAGAPASLAQSQNLPKPLWPAAAPGARGTADIDRPTLAPYLPAANPTRTAVVIAPGGGYEHLSMQKEGEDIAHWLNARGVAGFVLKYRLGPKYHYPVQLQDAQRAMRTVRSQAARYGIDPAHVGMWGFSAGGHLTALTGTQEGTGNPSASDPNASDPLDQLDSRPNFLVLAYPVISMDPAVTHGGSRKNLLGDDPTPALVEQTSNERRVNAHTPPTFLFATTDDPVVPVANSILFYEALVKAKVPVELHIYEHGPHGVDLAANFPQLKGWPDELARWMRFHGWMAPEPAH